MPVLIVPRFRGPYRFLSNFFHPCPVVYEDISYLCSESAYQAAKTEDVSQRQHIAALPHPADARDYGRQVVLQAGWEDGLKQDAMWAILWDKFTCHPELGQQLLATKPAFLIEGNSWNDVYWGVCDGVGENFLGKMLAQIRAHLETWPNKTCPPKPILPTGPTLPDEATEIVSLLP